MCAGAVFLSAVLGEYLRSSTRRTRKENVDWVRPWLLLRDSSGASARLVKELADEDSLSHKNHLKLTANKSEK